MPLTVDEERVDADHDLHTLVPLLGPVGALPSVGGCYRVHGRNAVAGETLDVEKSRGILRRTARSHAAMSDLAASLGYPVPHPQSVTTAAHRLVSLRLGGPGHPIPDDSRRRALRDGWTASWRRVDVPVRRRVRLCGVVPGRRDGFDPDGTGVGRPRVSVDEHAPLAEVLLTRARSPARVVVSDRRPCHRTGMDPPKPTESRDSVAWRIAGGTASNVAGQVVVLATAVLLSAVIVRSVGATDFGIWALVATVAGFGYLLELGISAGLVKYVAEHTARGELEEAARMIGAATWLYALLGTAVCLIGLVVAVMLPTIVGLHGHSARLARSLSIIAAFRSRSRCLPSPRWPSSKARTIPGRQRSFERGRVDRRGADAGRARCRIAASSALRLPESSAP